MGKLINSNNFNIPAPQQLPSNDIILPNVILGDESFALTTSMMKPFPRNQSLHDNTKTIHNYRHSRTRRTTENAFGILANTFRVFFTPINARIEKIDKIILASTILHNMMREEKLSSQVAVEMPVENIEENIALPTQYT